MDRMEFLHIGYSHFHSPTDQEVPFHGMQSHTQSVLFSYQHNIVLFETQRFLFFISCFDFLHYKLCRADSCQHSPGKFLSCLLSRETDRLSSLHRFFSSCHIFLVFAAFFRCKEKQVPSGKCIIHQWFFLLIRILSAR